MNNGATIHRCTIHAGVFRTNHYLAILDGADSLKRRSRYVSRNDFVSLRYYTEANKLTPTRMKLKEIRHERNGFN